MIMSVVRSCSSEEMKADNTREWRSKYIGFVGDANQINVGITRAKDGLCILGEEREHGILNDIHINLWDF